MNFLCKRYLAEIFHFAAALSINEDIKLRKSSCKLI